MKTCDICRKPTVFLEDLDYCSVCADCYAEIVDLEEDSFFETLNETKKSELDN